MLSINDINVNKVYKFHFKTIDNVFFKMKERNYVGKYKEFRKELKKYDKWGYDIFVNGATEYDPDEFKDVPF